ncbi:iron complex transport system ATP-binding protein [Corynebacterium lowii]|nr:iron complex transport system ATP-binding protein [Corynebacterium lowii]
MNEQREDLLIDFQDVSVIRGGTAILSSVTWQVELGQRWVIVGPNGAGKTTLVNIASASDYPSQGQVSILGERLGRTDVRDLRAAIGISSSALAHRIPDDELVGDLVVSAGYAVLGRWRERYDEQDFERAHDILEQVGGMHLIERRWGTLSEGERKRVLLARALMIDPEILILDEPTAAMDLGGREDLVAHLSELAENPDSPATVMITHHVEEIPQGFTHALLLDEGKVVAQGPIDEVLTSANLTTTFHQSIELTELEGRYFARRIRRGGSHRYA